MHAVTQPFKCQMSCKYVMKTYSCRSCPKAKSLKLKSGEAGKKRALA